LEIRGYSRYSDVWKLLVLFWRGCGFRRRDLIVVTELSVCAGEHCGGVFGQLYFPTLGEDAEDAKGAAGAEPAFCYFLKVLDAVDDVSPSVLLREV
jgi:hypothetical protein